MDHQTERVSFTGAFGDSLAARLERPAGETRAYALFAHCFTCSKDLKAAVRISRGLAARGIAVLRFDFTGIGESEGDFAGTDFSSNLDDLVAAADFLRREHEAPRLLVGHSLGGAAVLAAAARIPEARAVATIAAPSDLEHLRSVLLAQAPELETAGEARVNLGGRTVRVRRELLEDLAGRRLEEAVAGLGRALLLFHSPVDQTVAIEHATRLYRAARQPKSFVALDGADHLLLERPADAGFVAEVLVAWAGRYVAADTSAAEAGEQEKPEAAPHGRVVVEGGPSGYAQRIQTGPHTLAADEPVSVGGTDRGPGPYELLLAALGACKSMTLRMYADRKGWPLAGTRIELEHSRIHAEDCADCETKEGKVDRIAVAIGLGGPLDAEQRARLLEIADRCPVHRTLVSEISIQTGPLAD